MVAHLMKSPVGCGRVGMLWHACGIIQVARMSEVVSQGAWLSLHKGPKVLALGTPSISWPQEQTEACLESTQHELQSYLCKTLLLQGNHENQGCKVVGSPSHTVLSLPRLWRLTLAQGDVGWLIRLQKRNKHVKIVGGSTFSHLNVTSGWLGNECSRGWSRFKECFC